MPHLSTTHLSRRVSLPIREHENRFKRGDDAPNTDERARRNRKSDRKWMILPRRTKSLRELPSETFRQMSLDPQPQTQMDEQRRMRDHPCPPQTVEIAGIPPHTTPIEENEATPCFPMFSGCRSGSRVRKRSSYAWSRTSSQYGSSNCNSNTSDCAGMLADGRPGIGDSPWFENSSQALLLHESREADSLRAFYVACDSPHSPCTSAGEGKDICDDLSSAGVQSPRVPCTGESSLQGASLENSRPNSMPCALQEGHEKLSINCSPRESSSNGGTQNNSSGSGTISSLEEVRNPCSANSSEQVLKRKKASFVLFGEAGPGQIWVKKSIRKHTKTDSELNSLDSEDWEDDQIGAQHIFDESVLAPCRDTSNEVVLSKRKPSRRSIFRFSFGD